MSKLDKLLNLFVDVKDEQSEIDEIHRKLIAQGYELTLNKEGKPEFILREGGRTGKIVDRIVGLFI